MTEATVWWVIAGTLVALELISGTFYLLMLALGMVAGALAAHFGATTSMQIVAAAVVGAGFVVGWRLYRQSQPGSLPAGVNRDVLLDIGETVQVDQWDPDGNGSIRYRGARWDVSLLAGRLATPGLHRIVEVVGSRLVVEKL